MLLRLMVFFSEDRDPADLLKDRVNRTFFYLISTKVGKQRHPNPVENFMKNKLPLGFAETTNSSKNQFVELGIVPVEQVRFDIRLGNLAHGVCKFVHFFTRFVGFGAVLTR